jgi:uroporphyrin-III C-methyltransferase
MLEKSGMVYLVGAGPGDPELMTIRATRLLRLADTVLHDRLIPQAVLDWCRDEALVIDVGKHPNRARITQQEINQLLVQHAQQGQLVVRLKGGDPFVFGRGMEELEHCRQAGIECVVVPGVSSCIAGPAAMGVPVTTRGVARSFAVVTGHTDPNLEVDIDFESLANVDTVVLMMGWKNLEAIAKALIAAGRDPDTPAAAIENATLPQQRVVSATLLTLSTAVQTAGLGSPLVSVVGDVAAYANRSENNRSENISELNNLGYGRVDHPWIEAMFAP